MIVAINETHKKLCDSFLDYIMDLDDSKNEEAINQKIDLAHRKWVVYCHANGIKPEHYNSVKEQCKKLLDKFLIAEK